MSNILKKIAEFIVKARYYILAVFVGLLVFSIIMLPKTNVSYDLSTFLAKDSDTTKALEVMHEEFGENGLVTVMVKGVDVDRANEIASMLSAIEGVDSVMFLAESTYNLEHKSAMYSITFESDTYNDATRKSLINIIDQLKNEDAYYSGEVYAAYTQRQEVENQVLTIGIAIVLLIIAIVIFTSRSFFEVVIVVLVFGFAALINMGTNFMFGSISYLSNTISLVLQLALSIDYSLILLHRFMDERAAHAPKEAAVRALSKAIPEVLSSSLTTIAGLCSLILMSLNIGMDLGLSLAKGIIISLLCVIFVMPFFLVLFDKPLEKLKHRKFVPSVTKPVNKILGAKKIVAPIALVLVIGVFVGQFFNIYDFSMNSITYVDNQAEIGKVFGSQNTIAVLVPKGDDDKQRELISVIEGYDLTESVMGLASMEFNGIKLSEKYTYMEITEIAADFGISESLAKGLYRVHASHNDDWDDSLPIEEYEISIIEMMDAVSYLGLGDELMGQINMFIALKNNFESEHYTRIVVNVAAVATSEESMAFAKTLKDKVAEYYPTSYLAGETVVAYEMSAAFPSDNTKVTIATIGFLLLILLLTFMNVGLPAVLLLTILGGTWLNFTITAIFAVPISFIGYLIVNSMQMGATIDYAIILTNRFKEYRTRFLDPREAMSESVNAVLPTILTSGLILSFTGFILGWANPEGLISSLGMMLGRGTLFSMLMVLFVLPQFLLVTYKFTDKLDFSRLFKRKSNLSSPTDDMHSTDTAQSQATDDEQTPHNALAISESSFENGSDNNNIDARSLTTDIDLGVEN